MLSCDASIAFNDYCLVVKIIPDTPCPDPNIRVLSQACVCPADFFGDVIGDLSSRRGRIEETEDRLNLKVIKAKVPLAEMFGYATGLRSLTEGRGTFTMEFDYYEIVPQNIAQEIIEGKRR